MGKFRDKLRSERGASILLALLFFLVCAMVGASVLMAAASNAGKSRANREEQQKYLTLSSALRLVCDELEAAKYTAKYTVNTKVEQLYKYDNETDAIYIGDRYEHTYTPADGEITGWDFTEVPNVLPIVKELDKVFAYYGWKDKQDVTLSEVGSHSHFYGTKPSTLTVDPHTVTLTVTPDNGTWLAKSVEITVELCKTSNPYRIDLKASLVDDNTYIMHAVLLINSDEPKLVESKNTTAGEPTIPCTAAKWKLSQITREEAK